ncbi:MAG: hypothetical protein HZB39_03795 [Planctomycetes bacterium]|nr:hypothetical protein [Planctomycetota bacterium]
MAGPIDSLGSAAAGGARRFVHVQGGGGTRPHATDGVRLVREWKGTAVAAPFTTARDLPELPGRSLDAGIDHATRAAELLPGPWSSRRRSLVMRVALLCSFALVVAVGLAIAGVIG